MTAYAFKNFVIDVEVLAPNTATIFLYDRGKCVDCNTFDRRMTAAKWVMKKTGCRHKSDLKKVPFY